MMSLFKKSLPAEAVITRLRELATDNARDDPIHFAGRTEIIESVLSFANRPPERRKKGATVVIAGAPGAGKTALVCEIERRLRAAGAGTVMCAEVPGSQRAVQDIYRKVANHLCGLSMGAGQTTETRRAGFSGRIVGAGFRRDKESSVSLASVESTNDVLALRKGSKWPRDRRAVVFIDEIQNIELVGPAQRLARDLHTQGVAPILLVCAGLANSRARLGKAKLSRVDNIFLLGPLSRNEAVEAARKTLEKVREELHIPGGREAISHLAEMIARESDGWPMHIHNQLRGVWRSLVEQEVPSFDAVDPGAAAAVGRELRDEYYEARIEAAEVPVEIIGALLRAVAQGEKQGETRLSDFHAAVVIKQAVDAMDEGAAKNLALELVGNGKSSFERMLRAGIVSIDKSRRCVSPIPSLARHVAEQCSDAVPNPPAG